MVHDNVQLSVLVQQNLPKIKGLGFMSLSKLQKVIQLVFLTTVFLTGCTGIPENVQPVGNFELEKYLGRWYEIARLDHSFERGLTKVTAEYSLRDDGGVRVINSGFSEQDKAWESVEGKAYFVEGSDKGYLKVSFFGPFYGAYVVTELDRENYQYALVSGPSKSYLWILSRSPTLDRDILNSLLEKAKELGFETDQLIFVDH